MTVYNVGDEVWVLTEDCTPCIGAGTVVEIINEGDLVYVVETTRPYSGKLLKFSESDTFPDRDAVWIGFYDKFVHKK